MSGTDRTESTTDVQTKYADAWTETNCWRIPKWAHVPHRVQSAEEREIFAWGMWTILQEMVTDGVLSSAAVGASWRDYLQPAQVRASGVEVSS